MPNLEVFNEVDVNGAEREVAAQTFRLLLLSGGKRLKGNAARFEQMVKNCCVGSMSGSVANQAPANLSITTRKDLEYRYPYKSQLSGATSSVATAGLGTSTLVSCTVQDMVGMALRKRRAEERFDKVRINTDHFTMSMLSL